MSHPQIDQPYAAALFIRSADRRPIRIPWTYSIALALVFVMAVAAKGMAQDSFSVRDISSFVFCLRQLQGPRSAIDAVKRCMPPGCKVTLTMSTKSAQAACSLGGCQLPRVLFDCPDPRNKKDPKRFRPSFLLCPVDSTGGSTHFGTDRIEVGQDRDDVNIAAGDNSKGGMNMADIPAPPNSDFTSLRVIDVQSSSGANNKRCNLCHKSAGTEELPPPFPPNLLSKPIDPFGKAQDGSDLAPFIMDTNDMRFMPPARGSRLMGKDAQRNAITLKGTDDKPLTAQNLEDVCKCINDPQKAQAIRDQANDPAIAVKIGQDKYNKDGNFSVEEGSKPDGNKNKNPDTNMTLLPYLHNLCAALLDYRTSFACGKADPDPTLACSGVNGGGKFLLNTGVSMLRLGFSGSSNIVASNSFSFNDIEGVVSAYNYSSRTLIDSGSLSSLQVTLAQNGDIQVIGAGTAFVSTPLVSGASTNIQFIAAQKATGVVSANDCGLPSAQVSVSGSSCFAIFSTDGGIALLAGGIGEARRTALQFTPDAP